MTPTTHYQYFSQYDTDYTLLILLSVWHRLHFTNPSLSMTQTNYTLPTATLLSVWHWLHITNLEDMTPTARYQRFFQYDTDYTLPVLLSVWHRLHFTNPSFNMTPTTLYPSFCQCDTDCTLPILLSVWHRLLFTNPSLSMTPTSKYSWTLVKDHLD